MERAAILTVVAVALAPEEQAEKRVAALVALAETVLLTALLVHQSLAQAAEAVAMPVRQVLAAAVREALALVTRHQVLLTQAAVAVALAAAMPVQADQVLSLSEYAPHN